MFPWDLQRWCAMIATPRELLDTSIAQLQLLMAFLGDQLGESARESRSSDTPDIRDCQKIFASLELMLAELRAARPKSAGVRSAPVTAGEGRSSSGTNRSARSGPAGGFRESPGSV